VIGAEVLARWQHPTRGLLLPEDFLAAIAAYYLLDEVTKQVFVQGTLLQANLCRLG
jgi:EAL domain-containing protein (putative c-di-GMP-specific phosphodiesterase class I)